MLAISGLTWIIHSSIQLGFLDYIEVTGESTLQPEHAADFLVLWVGEADLHAELVGE